MLYKCMLNQFMKECVICDAKFVQKAGLDKQNNNLTRARSKQ